METTIDCLHRADLSLRNGAKLAENVFLQGNVTFGPTTPYGVSSRETHPARFLEPHKFSRWYTLEKGNRSTRQISDLCSISPSTLDFIQKGSHPEYIHASQIVKGFGGRALYLAFSDRPFDGQPQAQPILVTGPKDYRRAAASLFKELREQRGLTRKQVVQASGLSMSEVAITEGGTRVNVPPIADHFKRAFNIHVAYCAVWGRA